MLANVLEDPAWSSHNIGIFDGFTLRKKLLGFHYWPSRS